MKSKRNPKGSLNETFNDAFHESQEKPKKNSKLNPEEALKKHKRNTKQILSLK